MTQFNELLGTDIGGAKGKQSSKKKTGKMWDFNIEQGKAKPEEVLNMDQERLEEDTEYDTIFGEKISEVPYAHQRLATCRSARTATSRSR